MGGVRVLPLSRYACAAWRVRCLSVGALTLQSPKVWDYSPMNTKHTNQSTKRPARRFAPKRVLTRAERIANRTMLRGQYGRLYGLE